MAKKTNSFIDYELDFLEKTLKEMESYIRKIDLGKLEDRFVKRGSRDFLTGKKEDQRKDHFAAVKEYAEIAKIISGLREVDATTKREIRGDQKLTPFEEGVI